MTQIMKKWDFIIIAIVLLAGLGSWLLLRGDSSNPADRQVEIHVDGVLTNTVSLSENQEIPIVSTKGHNLLRIRDGSAWIVKADCASQTCVHTGRKSVAGSMIVCLPNRVVVKILGQPEGVDAIAS
jgi:hypothetical protein